ncbi:MAG: ATP-binding protein [Nitrospirota bacterium]|jgi:signal transduction histidine kinase
MSREAKRVSTTPVLAVTISLVTVTAALLLLATKGSILAGWRWPNEPLHALVEGVGAFIALCLAALLLHLDSRGQAAQHHRPIAGAFIAMGLLDVAHAATAVGNAFVWFHSIATLAGGALFSLVWLPRRHVTWLGVWTITIVCAGLVVGSVLGGDRLPAMIQGGEFTTAARALNIVGGVLFLSAGARLLLGYWTTRDHDDLLFTLLCGLLGGAGALFELSQLWDLTWWTWHLLRLFAYGIGLSFMVLHVRREETKLRRSNAALGRARRVLEQTVADLERSNRELEQFAYVASHDLQEPLRMVGSFTQLLDQRYGDRLDDDGREFITYAVEGAHRMQELIQSLLVYSRVGSRGPEFAQTDCQAVLDRVLSDQRAIIEGSDAMITVTPLPTLPADAVQVGHLFQHLILNAIKFRGDQPLAIDITAEEQDGVWHIAVRDNGIGIDPQYAERIFTLFQRLHPRDRYPGTGIGLAVCKKIVHQHGGHIWVESQPHRGATFHFTLPGYREPVSDDGSGSLTLAMVIRNGKALGRR